MSLKRSNTSFSNNPLKANSQTKVPKICASLRHTPVTLKDNGCEDTKFEGLDECVDRDSFQRPISCFTMNTNNKTYARGSVRSPVLSEFQKSDVGIIGLHRRKMKAMESADGSVDYPSVPDDLASNIPKRVNNRKLSVKSDANTVPSVYFNPGGPSLRRSYFTKSAEELKALLLNIKGRTESNISQSSNNLHGTNSDQSVGNNSTRNIKSILKTNLDKSHESVCFRKKVRFDLGPEILMPETFSDLYTSSKINDYRNLDLLSSNENLQIPEKDITAVKDEKSRDVLNKMHPYKLLDNVESKNLNVFEDISCLDLRNGNTKSENGNFEAVKMTLDSNENIPARNDICHNSSKDEMITQNKIKKEEIEILDNVYSNHPRSTFRPSKSKKTTQKSIKKLCSGRPHSLSKIYKSIIKPPTMKKEKTKSVIYENNSKHEQNISQTAVDLKNLPIDNLLNCPKKELLEFLKSLSSAISLRDDSKSVSKALLRGFLEDLKTKQEESCSVIESQHIGKRASSEVIHTKNHGNPVKVDPILEQSISEDIDNCSVARGSSVTSVSSLRSTCSSIEQSISEPNKSIRILHRCHEETFCNDNMNECDKLNIKTEYKNYSPSSSDSKKTNDLVLSTVLDKLTSLLEVIDKRFNELPSADETRLQNKMPTDSSVMLTSKDSNEINITNSSSIKDSKCELKENTSSSMSEATSRNNINLRDDENTLNVVINPFNSQKKALTDDPACAPSNFIQNNGLMLLTKSPNKIAFNGKSHTQNEIVIRLIDESVSLKKKINMTFMFPPLRDCPETSDNKINKNLSCLPNQNNNNGNSLFKQLPQDSEQLNINTSDVQSILKQINDKINSVKLNGPTMYESGKSHKEDRQKSSVSLKDVSQTVQRSLNGFFQTLYKHIPNKDMIKSKITRKRSRSIVSNRSRKDTIDGNNPFFETLKNFLPFCKPSEGSDDELEKANYNKPVGKCDQKGIQTDNDYKSKTIQNCEEGWPDLRRTRYPNGKLYYGPLIRMPEPKMCRSRSNSEIPLVQYNSDYSTRTFGKTVYRKSLSQKFTFSDINLERKLKASYEQISLEEKHTIH